MSSWPLISDQIGTETVSTPFGALTLEMTTSKLPRVGLLLTIEMVPLKSPWVASTSALALAVKRPV